MICLFVLLGYRGFDSHKRSDSRDRRERDRKQEEEKKAAKSTEPP